MLVTMVVTMLVTMVVWFELSFLVSELAPKGVKVNVVRYVGCFCFKKSSFCWFPSNPDVETQLFRLIGANTTQNYIATFA